MKRLYSLLMKYCSEHVFYIGATLLSAGVHFIYSIYVKSYITPLEYGMYSTCALLQTYMAYLQLGTLNSFNRDYPQLVGAGKVEEARKYRNTIFSFLLGIYGIGFLIISSVVLFRIKMGSDDSRLLIGFLLIALISVASIVENYGDYRCRIDKGFKYTSFAILLELLSLPIGLALVPRIGYYSLYIISIISILIKMSLYFKHSYCDFHFGIDSKLLKGILFSGLPLLINGLIWTVVNSIDKFVILGFINTEALGVYGIAQNAFSYMVLIPSAMSQLFYVKMGKEYGKNGSRSELLDVSLKLSTVLAASTSLIALVAFYFLPILVDAFLPNYRNGVPSSQILILGLSVYSATLINGNILTILKKNRALLVSSICMCLFNGICSIGLIYMLGATIESVALGTAVSYIFCTLILVFQVQKYASCKLIRIITSSILPVCISLMPGIIFYNLIGNRIIGFVFSIIFVFVFYCLFYGRSFLSLGGKEE